MTLKCSHFQVWFSAATRILHGCPFRHHYLGSAPLYVTFSTRVPAKEARFPSTETKGRNLRSLNGVQTVGLSFSLSLSRMASRHGLAFAPRVSVFHGSNENVIAIKAFIRITTSIRCASHARCTIIVCVFRGRERKTSFPVPSNSYVGIKSVRKCWKSKV